MKTEWLKKLSEVEVKIASLKETEVASSDREKRQLITSPVDGIVKKLYFNTIGGIVKSGDRIAEITPIDDSLVIEAKIKTNDRGDLVVGQDVAIEISAYSYSKYGYLKGKLIYISPDSFSEQNGLSYYTVKIKADHYEVAKGKEILPGMMATIHIKTGKKTILEYILKPLKDIQKNALIEK
jgi:HlyD family secretion protein/adhesin transport system membrane fusion protein